MSVDHESHALINGDEVWIPATVTAVNPDGTINTTNAYSGLPVHGMPGTDVHKKGMTNWPGVP